MWTASRPASSLCGTMGGLMWTRGRLYSCWNSPGRAAGWGGSAGLSTPLDPASSGGPGGSLACSARV